MRIDPACRRIVRACTGHLCAVMHTEHPSERGTADGLLGFGTARRGFLLTASCDSFPGGRRSSHALPGCSQIAWAQPIRAPCATNPLRDRPACNALWMAHPGVFNFCSRRACSERRWEPLQSVLQRTERAGGRVDYQAPARESAPARPAGKPTMHAHDQVARCGRACARSGWPDYGRERMQECLLPLAMDAAWQR